VVAKAPVAGLAKTRLCPPATPAQAARVAAAALLDTLAAVRATGSTVPVLAHTGRFTDAEHAAELTPALTGWHLLPQRGGSFADRLANAHADAGAAFPGRPVLQIGMDTPQVQPATLAAALRQLAEHDAVFGPAADGGWWALGLRDPAHATVLRGVPMSTAETGRGTLAALRDRGVRPAALPVLRDVDDWPAAEEVARQAPGSRFAHAVRVVAAELLSTGAQGVRR
jgi:glycosyltransferase A (GT-A) superfamily protein (DUF2064 family)